MDATRLYYYRPLAKYPQIYKCAGFGAENHFHRAFYEVYFDSEENCRERGFCPGVVVLEGYRGDRISRDSAGNWQEVS
jgi:hypothetical protein